MTEPRTGVAVLTASDGMPVELSYLIRRAGPPVLYLHGLGSSKADFAGALDPAGLPGYTVLAIDFPGSGDSRPVLPTPSMDRLADLALTAIAELLDEPPVVIGHSMGGLVGLLAADRAPERVRAFVSVEGNLAPEDCFLSRRAFEWRRRGGGDPDTLVREILDHERRSGLSGHAEYALRAPREVGGRAFVEYSESIVEWSDHRRLLDMFLGLQVPATFVRGEENGGLSYLGRLEAAGARVRVVPDSAHFPQYSNPGAFYAVLRELLG